MAKKLSKVGIVTNQLVLPHQVTQSIDAFTGEEDYDINLSGSLAITGSTTIKLGGLTISDSVLGPGSLNVTNITASNLQVVNISSSFVTSSTIYTSGSNIFGDEPSDTHTFIGGITASGVMSASGVVFGSQVRTPAVFTNTITEKTSTSGVTIEGTLLKDNNVTTTDITTAGTITAGGNTSIPASSKLLLDGPSGNDYLEANVSFFNIYRNGSQRISIGANSTDFFNSGTNGVQIINTPLKVTGVGYISSSGNIETDGYFSGSGAGLTNIPAAGITGLNLSRIASGSVTASIAPDKGFEVNTNITSSGNISANGNIQNLDGSALFQRTSTGANSVLNVRQLSTGNIAEFGTNTNNELVVILSDGKVGIGTNSPTEALDVTGNIKVSGDIEAATFTNPTLDIADGSANMTVNLPLTFGDLLQADVGRLNISHDNSNGSITNRTGDLTIANSNGAVVMDATDGVKILNIADNSNTGYKTVVVDTSNGKLYRTGSYGGGGGGGGAGIFIQTGSYYATTNDLQVTGSTIFKGKAGGSSQVLELKNATSQGSILKIHSDHPQSNRPIGIYFSGSGNTTDEDFSIGINRVNGTFAIGAGAENAMYASPVFEMGTTGDITASGNLKLSNTSPLIQFDETDTTDENWAFINSGGTMTLRTANDAFSAYVTRMTFLQNGNVGIGNASPAEALDVTGNINASGEIECTKFVANAAGGFEFEIDGDNQFNMVHNFANRSMFFVTAAGTGTINFGTNNVNSQVSITSAGNLNVVNDLTVGGSVDTGAITASGNISCSFQESTITATTGSFNHIITDGETLEFRDATTRAKVGALKFDATNGLEVRDSAGNEGKLKTSELNIPSGGSMIINASQINFNSLPTSDPRISGRLYMDGRSGAVLVSLA